MANPYSRTDDIEDGASQVFMARQPIFDASEKVFGYELLFRSSLANYFPMDMNKDIAASRVLLDSFLLIGMDVLSGGKKAFLNFTRSLLVSEAATLFPKDGMVIEVLETIEPDDEVIAACKKLKSAGYLLALDDFVFRDDMRPLISLADIIKVDFLGRSSEERADIVERVNRQKVRLLAERVETKADVDEARALGYTLFQGYFFSKPKVLQHRDIPGYKLNYLRMMNEVVNPNASFDRIEHIVKSDVALTFKLLRFINSAAFCFQSRIESIRHALTLLGLREIRKWVSVMALSNIGQDKCEELVTTSLVRARFCELIAPYIGMRHRANDLFLMGMFSLVDAFLDRPIKDILDTLPLDDDIKAALLGETGKFLDVLDLTIAYEQGAWDDLAICAARLQLSEEEIPRLYIKSVELANQAFREMPAK